MKQITVIALVLFINTVVSFGQQIYIAPNSGINFSTITYRSGGKDINSTLNYPYFSNLNPAMGADIIYKSGKLKHVLSFSSLPFGASFRGEVKFINSNSWNTIFSSTSFQRQLGVGYQLFKERIITKSYAQRQISVYYGGGVGVGFNRTKFFYDRNYFLVKDGRSSSDGYFYNYEYKPKRLNTALFAIPELGFTLHNKKDNPILNASFYYFLGLTPMTSFNLKLQYGKLNSSYFKEENQLLKTKGGVFGFKVGVPIKLFQFKKHGK